MAAKKKPSTEPERYVMASPYDTLDTLARRDFSAVGVTPTNVQLRERALDYQRANYMRRRDIILIRRLVVPPMRPGLPPLPAPSAGPASKEAAEAQLARSRSFTAQAQLEEERGNRVLIDRFLGQAATRLSQPMSARERDTLRSLARELLGRKGLNDEQRQQLELLAVETETL